MLLKGISFGMALIINIIIICLWHFLSYILSLSVGQKHTNYRSFPYKGFSFEKKGKFYSDNFDIDAWFGILPIKYNREEIDIKKIEEADIPKLKTYLALTCRSEMCSLVNCLYFLFAIFANDPYLGFILGVIVVFCNLPFIAANRYARFLLLKGFANKRKQRVIQEYIEENNPDKYDLDSF